MYLSRLILNPRNRLVQRDLSQPYQMHRSVMRAFPGREALTDESVRSSTEERVLFRVDDHPSLHTPILIVQSRMLPDWSWLSESAAQGYLLKAAHPNPAVKPVHLTLSPGQVLSFRLQANPTAKKTVDIDGEKRKLRVGLMREADQVAWLRRKLEAAGAELLASRVTTLGTQRSRKGSGEEHRLQTHFAVRFDGVLRVHDHARLLGAVQAGVGSAKGYGFGLLSLAPAPA
jgi:CRISPR system Cascade subunit CasE